VGRIKNNFFMFELLASAPAGASLVYIQLVRDE
jgi:hypothetical protein